MADQIQNVSDYLASLDEQRRQQINALRQTLRAHLPDTIEEKMAYGMIGYVVSRERYPAGYHVNPEEDLPFLALAGQKRYVSVYHMALSLFPEVEAWYRQTYRERFGKKPNMGKSCLRFTVINERVLQLIGELCERIEVDAYIAAYERVVLKKS